ncbi:DUF4383 domain-containing protein [Cryptosporangium sp. NPDC048952]|uniref:DUF4383 domain-containing protein n=1 Tax=Cryptosporangium sp. NPDC048952 TaxID=3363961 RepID=UPI0037166155
MSKRPLIQVAAVAVGAVFLLVGIASFVPGLTSDYHQMSAAGRLSHAKLLGFFEVSALHNAVHLLFGVVGVMLVRTPVSARCYLVGGGAIYLILWVYGLLIDQGSAANFVPVNTADNWLHLLLGVGMLAVGMLLGRRVAISAP